MSDGVNFGALQRLWMGALLVGVISFLVGVTMLDQFARPELAPLVICFALASIAFGGVFYFGSLIFVRGLTRYILSDDIGIRGANVEMVTKTAGSGDPEIDRWIKKFVFARNTFGLGVVPVLLLGGLLLFG